MAVKACADKLVNEVQKFGHNFERYTLAFEEEEETALSSEFQMPLSKM
jgi:hypothetical protein